jgi:predicted GIY-YIG superfamily endonuclease
MSSFALLNTWTARAQIRTRVSAKPLLVYVAEFDRVNDAIDWEKHLKRWSHRKKRALAESK